MASLLSVAEVRDVVATGLDSTRLQGIIDREEAEVIRRYGAHYDGGVTQIVETVAGGTSSLFLRRPIASVVSISEAATLGATAAVVASTGYAVWADQGRVQRIGGIWGEQVSVTYLPADDSARRKMAIVEFVRIALERTAMKGEGVGGEYSFQAPEWDALRATLYRNLGFYNV